MTYRQIKNRDGSISAVVARSNEDGSISYIPDEPVNRDWIEYQKWLASGNTPDPA